MIAGYKYTEKEQKTLLKSMVLIADSREQANKHITDYLTQKEIPFVTQKLDFGDYSYMLPACPDLGIYRDLYFSNSIVIERKNSLDELAGNFGDGRTQFENEFMRADKCDMTLMVEQPGGYGDILAHKYNSQMNERAFFGSLITFECRYNIKTAFVDKAMAGQYIFAKFYYHLRGVLKK